MSGLSLDFEGCCAQMVLVVARSIAGWKALKDKFVSNFMSSKQQFKTEHHLERIKQKSDEPLRDFIIHFNAESLEVCDVAPNMMLYFLRQGLKPGGFTKDVAGEKPKTMEELNDELKSGSKLKNGSGTTKQITKPPGKRKIRKRNKRLLTEESLGRMREHMTEVGGRPEEPTQITHP
jgi:hypothetical protein